MFVVVDNCFVVVARCYYSRHPYYLVGQNNHQCLVEVVVVVGWAVVVGCFEGWSNYCVVVVVVFVVVG